jgi:hypothetical protein
MIPSTRRVARILRGNSAHNNKHSKSKPCSGVQVGLSLRGVTSG